MLGITHRIITERRQFIDNITKDKVIETKIKECRQKSSRCMAFTSKRLRIFYGDEKISHILQRLCRRMKFGNNYQEIFSL